MRTHKAEMKFHALCRVLPEMPEREFTELVKDIGENGLRVPITVHEGQIVDGRHRYRACVMSGVTPIYVSWDRKGTLVNFIISQNLRRRHLTASQKAMFVTRLLPELEKEAALRKLKPLKEHTERVKGRKQSDDPSRTGKNGDPQRSAGTAARIAGCSVGTVQNAKRIRKTSEKLAAEVERGTMTIGAAIQALKATPSERSTILKKAKVRGAQKAVRAEGMTYKRQQCQSAERAAGRIESCEKLADRIEGYLNDLLKDTIRFKLPPFSAKALGALRKTLRRIDQTLNELGS